MPKSITLTSEEALLVKELLKIIGKDDDLNEQFGMQIDGDIDSWNEQTETICRKCAEVNS
jgi:hypothetical protein